MEASRMRIDILTLFPDMFNGFLTHSIIRRAIDGCVVDIRLHDIRVYTHDKHHMVDDYPYGFRLRCKIRYWIETTKRGQRFVSQTTNPKKAGEHWNKPKKSTYSDLLALYLDENDHVKYDALSHCWSSPEWGEEFQKLYPQTCASDYGQKALFDFGAIKKAQSVLTCSVEIEPPDRTDKEREALKKHNEEVKRKALNYGFIMQKKEVEARDAS